MSPTLYKSTELLRALWEKRSTSDITSAIILVGRRWFNEQLRLRYVMDRRVLMNISIPWYKTTRTSRRWGWAWERARNERDSALTPSATGGPPDSYHTSINGLEDYYRVSTWRGESEGASEERAGPWTCT